MNEQDHIISIDELFRHMDREAGAATPVSGWNAMEAMLSCILPVPQDAEVVNLVS